ncbi:VWA domain-containing protein [Aestuariimicrobium sp. Y1814]|uniref:VWA domain-containing protein n=1 Tax=Aestuariimicrobium sp. Y1814 TaxID=3418742 RepID=UPI003DA6D7C8
MALMSLEFLLPQRLWWLLVVPAIGLLYLYLASLRPASRRRSSKLDLVLPRDRAWKRHLAVILALLAMVSLIVAYAKPKDFTEVPRERATVVVAIDVSRSMMAEDVEPNRMEAAQTAAKDFLKLLPDGFNVALVAFAGTSSLVVPPTTDRGAVSRAIDNLELAPSTAIGDGIYSGLDALKLVPPDPDNPDEIAPAAIVLLSDGATNTGRPSLQAARDAKAANVPVYTIAYGTATGYVLEKGVRQPVPVNHRELSDVAKESGGRKLSAANDKELADAYSQIARSIGYEKVYVEVTERYAGWALLFGIAAALATMSLAARWP